MMQEDQSNPAIPQQLKKTVTFLLCLLLGLSFTLLSQSPSYSQSSFSDLQNYWGQSCIETLTQENLFTGYPNGTFRPNSPMTRTEFAVVLGNAFPELPQVRPVRPFRDVGQNFWGREAIENAYRLGLLTGFPNQLFQPQENVTRVQALIALVAGLDYQPTQQVDSTLTQAYSDFRSIPDYAKSAIAAATENQLVVNYPNVRRLNPNTPATRGEVAAFLCQAKKLANVLPSQYIVNNPTRPAEKKEIRGVWMTNIDSDVLFSPNRLTSAIEQLDELNFNTLYPTVWNWGYTLYPSPVAEQITGVKLDPEEGLQGRDLLQEIITIGHQKNMAVIPWFEFGFMAPADSELAKRHPDWLTQRHNGETVWVEGGVHDRVWLNPLHPQVQQFITDLIVEIVSNYDVDGIQLDDHFGYPADFGYDSLTVEQYRQEHNGQDPPRNPQTVEWLQWRADRITAYVETLFAAIKKANPNAIVSLSPNPQEFSFSAYLLDWEEWNQRGLIEELIVQLYRDSVWKFREDLRDRAMVQAKGHIPVGVGVLTGLKRRSVPSRLIREQVETVRENNYSGVSFFFYESLFNYTDEPLEQRQNLFKSLFPTPVPRP